VGADTATPPVHVELYLRLTLHRLTPKTGLKTLDAQSDPPSQTPTNMAQRGNMLVAGHICRHTTWAVAPVSSLYNSSIHQQQLVLTATVVGSTARMIKLDYILRQVDDTEVPLGGRSNHAQRTCTSGTITWHRILTSTRCRCDKRADHGPSTCAGSRMCSVL
jgi:hypothetical protein